MTATLEPTQVVQRLDEKAAEMDTLAASLADIREGLDPLERTVDSHVDTFVANLWDDYVAGTVKKWPGEDVRRALAFRELDDDTRNEYIRLKRDEKFTTSEIARVEGTVSAYQSILSAQKAGLV